MMLQHEPEQKKFDRRLMATAGGQFDCASECLRQSDTVLARRTGEVETGIESADIVLVVEVRAVERHDILAVVPGELRVHNIALPKPVTQSRVFEQCRPLRRLVAVVHPGCQRVAVIEVDFVLRPYVERKVWRICLLMPT